MELKASIKIKNKDLPELLSRISEALKTEEDLEIIGDPGEGEYMEFTEEEIREMEAEFYCSELDENVTGIACGWCELGSTCGHKRQAS